MFVVAVRFKERVRKRRKYGSAGPVHKRDEGNWSAIYLRVSRLKRPENEPSHLDLPVLLVAGFVVAF